MTTLQNIPIEKIHPGRNPRTHFDEAELEGLANSIRARGQKQPIVVEPDKDGYLLVMGERRLRAVKMLGQTSIEAYVRERTNHNGRERFVDAVIENDQREEMTPMDTARAYQVLHDEYGMTVRQISKLIGKRESTIDHLLLLTQLDEEIQTMIDEGFWKDMRLARGLLQITDKDTRLELAHLLWKRRAPLKACLAAVEKALTASRSKPKRTVIPKDETPAIVLSAASKPASWDMLKQLGRVPEWELVVLSAARTCEKCPLRSMASRITCQDCGAVEILRKLMEGSR